VFAPHSNVTGLGCGWRDKCLEHPIEMCHLADSRGASDDVASSKWPGLNIFVIGCCAIIAWLLKIKYFIRADRP